MKGQRAYCDRDHPGSDAEADQWCERYHWVDGPGARAALRTAMAVFNLVCIMAGGAS